MALTPQELTERRNYIGGSDAAAILGLNPYRNATDVYLEKTGQLHTQQTTSRPADLGNRLEPILVQLAADTLNITNIQHNHRFHKDWRSAQVDGYLPDQHEIIEAKAVGLFNPRFNRDEWGAEHTDEIPFMYLVQVLWQLHVSDAHLAHVTALLGGGLGHRMYRIQRNEDLIQQIDQRISTFWHEHVIPQNPPTNPATLDTYKEVIREPAKQTEIDNDLPILYQAALVNVTEAEEQRDALKARILQQIGDAEIGTTPFGEFHYTANKRGVRTLRLKGANND